MRLALKPAILIASVVCLLPTAAHASVTLFVDLFEQQNDSDFTLIAFGSAEVSDCAQEPYTYIDVYLRQNGNTIASNSSSGPCYAQATASHTQDIAAWTDGQYEALGSAPGHGCAATSRDVSAFVAAYQLVKDNGNGYGAYSRCDTGSCLNMTFKTVRGYPAPPPYIFANVLRVSYGGGFANCFGYSNIALGSCP